MIKKLTALTLKNVFVAISLVILSSLLRVWPLNVLGNTLAWLTYYPTIMLASIYGGFLCGLISTISTILIITQFWFLISPLPFIANQYDVIGMIVFVITSIMMSAVSEAMIRSKHAAELSNQAKTIFLANMSHELRTPLNIIIGFMNKVIKEHPDMDLSLRSDLLKVLKSADDLNEIINDVLEISKIERNRLELDEKAIMLRDVVSSTLRQFEHMALSKLLDLKVTVDPRTPELVYVDEFKLKAILKNLLSNSIKYTEYGSIELKLDVLSSTTQNSIIKFSVIDTGLGINEDELHFLFKLFTQTESGKNLHQGTGLGLSISQEYAKLMHSEIIAESKLGVGSTFSFVLDMRLATEIESGTTDARIVGNEQTDPKFKILIVDDNEDNRLITESILKCLNVTIYCASDGEEAIDIYRKQEIHLIFMDIRMPKMDGIQATKIIRSLDPMHHCKIIGLSAHIFKKEVSELMEAGCDDFLPKPYSEQQLLQRLEKYIDIHYIYEYQINKPESDITSTDLSRLSKPIIESLLSAVSLIDDTTISELLDNISIENPNVAQYIKTMYFNFNHRELLRSLKEEEERRNNSGI